jgi:hypothetical protein
MSERHRSGHNRRASFLSFTQAKAWRYPAGSVVGSGKQARQFAPKQAGKPRVAPSTPAVWPGLGLSQAGALGGEQKPAFLKLDSLSLIAL